jgi:hypothetical protein
MGEMQRITAKLEVVSGVSGAHLEATGNSGEAFLYQAGWKPDPERLAIDLAAMLFEKIEGPGAFKPSPRFPQYSKRSLMYFLYLIPCQEFQRSDLKAKTRMIHCPPPLLWTNIYIVSLFHSQPCWRYH